MARLKVREPDTLTRVTEYVPEIVAFVERIMQNGYGYEAEGSIYFDTRAFDRTDGHNYAKLEPWSKGNRELLEDGEGKLNSIDHWGHGIHYDQGLYPIRVELDQPLILLCGKPPNLANPRGHHRGGQVGRVGISSALSWQALSSVIKWISTREAWT